MPLESAANYFSLHVEKNLTNTVTVIVFQSRAHTHTASVWLLFLRKRQKMSKGVAL